MLQNRIASVNVLLILFVLTAIESSQIERNSESNPRVSQNKEFDLPMDADHGLNGRQLNQNYDFDFTRFNPRSAIYRLALETDQHTRSAEPSNGAIGNAPSGPIVSRSDDPNGKPVASPRSSPVGGAPIGSDTNSNGNNVNMKVKIPSTPQDNQAMPTQIGKPNEVLNGDNLTVKSKDSEEKLHGMHRLIQQLYVAQAQVQLEANEIQRAQAIAAAAQQTLEEASNNVRVITAALHAAQQTVASAAIRAQTAQLQLAAHDQLLFAARQRVDAVSAQIVSAKAEEGIQPTKMIVDLQALLDKLKEPLPDAQTPTAIPSILEDNKQPAGPKEAVASGPAGSIGMNVAIPSSARGKETCEYSPSGRCIKSFDRFERKGKRANKFLERANNLVQDYTKISPNESPGSQEKEQNLNNIITKGSDITQYADNPLKENMDESSYDQTIQDPAIRKELSGLNEKELRDLINFVLEIHHQQEENNDNAILDSKKIFEKQTDQRYINDFLNTIKNNQLKDEPKKELLVNEVIKRKVNVPENIYNNEQAKENSYDENIPIFNIDKAFEVNSENFQESLP